jgi:hypothetical protein
MTFYMSATAAHDDDTRAVLLLLGAKRGAKRQIHTQFRPI